MKYSPLILAILSMTLLENVCAGDTWTVMLYLDGDNNLEGWMNEAFRGLGEVGSTTDVNILVLFDRSEKDEDDNEELFDYYTSKYGDWTETRRFYITKGMQPDTTDYVSLGELNMGHPDTLKNFIVWASTAYPADYYALVLCDHGNGRAVCWDYRENDCLYMSEVKQAIKDSDVHFDVVAFAACLMGMIEVDYALRGLADFVIASEHLTIPIGDWSSLMRSLIPDPGVSPRDASILAVSEYSKLFLALTFSAVDMEKLLGLVEKVDDFANSMWWKEGNLEWDNVKSARDAVRSYPTSGGIDLYSFVAQVKEKVVSPIVKARAQAVMDAISEYVIANHSSSGNDHGVAIYWGKGSQYEEGNTFFPIDYVDEHYWDNFLRRYYDPPRNFTPNQITDLVASAGEVGWSVSLTWTVPGQGGIDPPVTNYIVKYSTAGSINDSVSWSAASEYSQTWMPEPSGYKEEKTITGLYGGTTYFLAVQTIGPEETPGSWSNSPSVVSPPDDTVPIVIGSVRDGLAEDMRYTNNPSQLSANWEGVFSDPESEIVLYEYAIGTTPGGTNLVDWTSTTRTSITVSDLDLIEERVYYFSVRAKNGQGEWSAPVSSNGQRVISQSFLLVYPTIFHSLKQEKLHIKYKIANSGRVRINVYNVAGEYIDTLLNEERPVEMAVDISWDGTNQESEYVSSGIYLVHISAPEFQATKKCALIK